MIRRWSLAALFLLPVALHQQDNDTCSADGYSTCKSHSSRSHMHKALSAVERIMGRIPHHITVADTSAIHISVKTAVKYHEERLSHLLLTWLQTLLPQQVYIVTDDFPGDQWTDIAENCGFNVAKATRCTTGHCRDCLCCKTGIEFEQYYLKREKRLHNKWFCHVDDDVYVNIQQLVHLLVKYDVTNEYVYLGRWSLNNNSKIKLTSYRTDKLPYLKFTAFAFGTGALYCISPLLMTELEPYFRGADRFTSTCRLLQYTDDMTIGATIEAILGYNFTDVKMIYSQFHGLNVIPVSKLPLAISISYDEITLPTGEVKQRRVNIPDSKFSLDEDPTRFLSYHCLIHPTTLWCK